VSKRYAAAVDICISNLLDKQGQPRLFTAGQELVGVKPSTLEPLLTTGRAVEIEDKKPPKPAKEPASAA
jgi:hypothetical protein